VLNSQPRKSSSVADNTEQGGKDEKPDDYVVDKKESDNNDTQ